MKANADAVLQAMLAHQERINEIADTLDVSLPFLTRVVMASDLESAVRVRDAVIAGELPAEASLYRVGSYARIKHLQWLLAEGRMDRRVGLRLLPELWPGSDPDDTDPDLLNLWREAKRLNNGTIHGSKLPRDKTLLIYRGQLPSDPIGFAWSLDRGIAQKFANGASFRTPVTGGAVIARLVARKSVLAYLTSRGEAEIIVDPETLL